MQYEPAPQARSWAMLCHLAAFAGFAFPLGNVLGPVVVWLLKRDTMPFVDDQGRETIDFQINLTIYYVVSLVLALVLVGIPLLILLFLANIILPILAAVSCNRGEPYRYPFVLLRLLS